MKKNKIFRRTLLITACIAFITIKNVKAQTIADAYARIDASGQNFSCSFIVELTDTVNTDEIEVSLSAVPDSNDVILRNFTFDASPPSGCTYNRSLLTLTLGLGTLAEHRTYYAKARVKNS